MSKTAWLGNTAPFTGIEEPQKPRVSTKAPASQRRATRGHEIPKQRSRQRQNTTSDESDDDDDSGGDPPSSRASKIYLTTAQLRKRWGGCSHMFIERRLKSDPQFPRPVKFGERIRLFDLDQIEAYERSRVYAGGDEAA